MPFLFNFHFLPMNKLRLYLIAIGVVLYLACLAMPTWECTNKGAPLQGFEVLMIGYLGLLGLDPRWFCNAVVLMAFYSLYRPLKRSWLPFVLAGIATTTVFGPFFCAPGGGSLGDGNGMAAGGYLWICALWVFAISTGVNDAQETG